MKGFIKTLEASIAVLLVLATVVALNTVSAPYPERSFVGIAEQCLDKIHYEGDLRYYAFNDLESQLTDDLGDCIPASISYKVEICSSSECSTTGLPDSTVVLASRLISGDQYEVSPRIINVWMWS